MKTLFDKIWDAHTVSVLPGGSCALYIDRQYIHEVTSPQAFDGLRQRGIGVFRPARITASPDHNIPTKNQHLPASDLLSREQLATLERNCADSESNTSQGTVCGGMAVSADNGHSRLG